MENITPNSFDSQPSSEINDDQGHSQLNDRIRAADKVEDAVLAIMRTGKTPTLNSVRNHIGSGSFETLSPVLAQTLKGLAALTTPGNEIPDQFHSSFRAMWMQALELASNNYKEEKRQYISTHESKLSELLKSTHKAQEECNRALLDRDTALSELNALKSLYERDKKALDDLSAQYDALLTKNQDLSSSYDSLRELASEKDALHEKNIQQIMASHRDEIKRIDKLYEASLDGQVKRISKLEIELKDSNDFYQSSRTSQKQLSDQLASSEAAQLGLIKVRDELLSSTQELTQKLSSLELLNHSLSSSLDREKIRCETLQSIVDRMTHTIKDPESK